MSSLYVPSNIKSDYLFTRNENLFEHKIFSYISDFKLVESIEIHFQLISNKNLKKISYVNSLYRIHEIVYPVYNVYNKTSRNLLL